MSVTELDPPVTPPPMPVDKSGQRVQRMFAAIAPRYDLLNHLLSANVDRAWRRHVARRLTLAPGVPMLDNCTGTGDLAIAIAKRHGPGVPIVASDFCRPMLAVGRTKLTETNRSQIEFVEADGMALPFADGTFQAVTNAFGLRNINDTERGIAEMVRVLRPGGTLAVLEFSRPRVWPLSAVYGLYFRQVLPRVGQYFADNDDKAYEYLPQSVSQFPDGAALTALFDAAGLIETKFEPLTLGIATLYTGVKPIDI